MIDWVPVFNSSMYIPRSKIPWSCGNSNFLKKHQTLFHSSSTSTYFHQIFIFLKQLKDLKTVIERFVFAKYERVWKSNNKWSWWSLSQIWLIEYKLHLHNLKHIQIVSINLFIIQHPFISLPTHIIFKDLIMRNLLQYT